MFYLFGGAPIAWQDYVSAHHPPCSALCLLRRKHIGGGAAGEARRVIGEWARAFDRLLIHVDVDVIDYADFPIAENTRRHRGLTFRQAMEAIEVLVSAPNWSALTVAEVNPDHGAADGSTMRMFAQALADALGRSPVLV